jgi:hypothetical protein
VLNSSISIFPPCVYNSYLIDRTYHSHTSFVPSHLHHYVTFLPECWLSFFQVLAFPFKVTWNAHVSPYSAIDSHICV